MWGRLALTYPHPQGLPSSPGWQANPPRAFLHGSQRNHIHNIFTTMKSAALKWPLNSFCACGFRSWVTDVTFLHLWIKCNSYGIVFKRFNDRFWYKISLCTTTKWGTNGKVVVPLKSIWGGIIDQIEWDSMKKFKRARILGCINRSVVHKTKEVTFQL